MPTDENIAESSPAEVVEATEAPSTAEPAAEAVTAPLQMEQWTEAQYKDWRLTGATPESKTAESTPAEAPEKATEEAATKPESGTGKPHKNADTRVQELLKDRAELRARLERLEAAKVEPKPEAAKAEAPKLEAPKAPRLADFEDFDKYEAACNKYTEDLTEYKTELKLQGFRAEEAQKAREFEERKQQEKVQSGWKKQVSEFEKSHKDFREVAFKDDTPITDVMAAYIRSSENGAAMLYHLGQNPESAREMSQMNGFDLARALVKLEGQFEGKQETAAAEALFKGAKVTTKAGPPAHELNGSATAIADPVAAAVRAGDFQAYQKHMNAQEIARRKQG